MTDRRVPGRPPKEFADALVRRLRAGQHMSDLAQRPAVGAATQRLYDDLVEGLERWGGARRLPGRKKDLDYLLLRYNKTMRTETRDIVFVGGHEGSGRTWLLDTFRDQLRRRDSATAVIAGGFNRGSYVPWEHGEPATAAVTATLREIEPTAGIRSFFAQLLSKARSPRPLLEGVIVSSGDELTNPRVAAQLFLALSNETPVVLLIDDLDQAQNGWWIDLILALAQRDIADSRLLVVATLDSPTELGRHADDEADILYVAKTMVSGELAQWRPLARLTNEDLMDWTGPVEPSFARSLLGATDGLAAWTAEMWHEWLRIGLVAQGEGDGRWELTEAHAAGIHVMDVELQRIALSIAASDLSTETNARALLSCAALEGRRFTADAVAEALDVDRDGLIDFLDDALGSDDQRPDGLLIDDGFEPIRDELGTRHLATYRFARQSDWLTLRHHGCDDHERRRLSGRLADALLRLYGPEAHRVALTASRLYLAARQVDRARSCQRVADVGESRHLILRRAWNILNAEKPTQPAFQIRASRTLIAAADTLSESGPYTDGLRLAEAAYDLAPVQEDRATALYLVAHHHNRLGAYDEAEFALMRLLEFWKDERNISAQARARHLLAINRLRRGAYAEARHEFSVVLTLLSELGDRRGEAAVRQQLAGLDLRERDYTHARTQLGRVLELCREFGDGTGEAAARQQLASIDLRQGDYGRARDELIAVLELYLELGDRAGEAAARQQLASIDLRQGDYGRARDELIAVLELYLELGDRAGEAAARQQLASIDLRQGDYGRARDELIAVLELYLELGDRAGEAAARQQLASIDLRQGDYGRARDELIAVLELYLELGDRAGEAAARQQLASIDLRQGDYGRARDELIAVLELFRELADPQGEETTRRLMTRLEQLG